MASVVTFTLNPFANMKHAVHSHNSCAKLRCTPGAQRLKAWPVRRKRRKRLLWYGLLACVAWMSAGYGQETKKDQVPFEEEPLEAPSHKIEVDPAASDVQIQERLTRILRATEWFDEPEVQVEEGVVFLTGNSRTEMHRKWAGELARNTEGVVAVVNRVQVMEPSAVDFLPALSGIRSLWREFVQGLPWILFCLLVLALSYGAARLTAKFLNAALARRTQNILLCRVIAFSSGLLVFLLGLYFMLRVAGLGQLAFTVLGGTGLLGIILGIGFRDITENFLASILLSWHHPFRTGDLIEVAGLEGYVERMTIRTSVLMTLDGNHVQIPNATIYKSLIRNFTSNPNRREDFTVGISYDTPIGLAQNVALGVLSEHPAVLKDPEPWVLVDGLGPSTVNMKVYFWLNGREHSWLKVKSSVIRLVKRALLEHAIVLPDERREVVFPQEIPVRLIRPEGPHAGKEWEKAIKPGADVSEPELAATNAEGGLSSEATELKQQSRQARTPEDGENLLHPNPSD